VDTIKKALDGPGEQIIIAWSMWLFAHINLATGVIAFFVVAYQLKASFFKSKLAKVQYNKACSKNKDIE